MTIYCSIMINKNIIAIIPARGGSKRLQRKNIRKFIGKPLISYSINVAQNVKTINRVIVSTDDDEIYNISKALNSSVIMRPNELAEDFSSPIDVINHVVETLSMKENYNVDIVILLQPTSPLRTSNDIRNALEIFVNSKANSVVSVYPSSHPPFWSLVIENNKIKPLLDQKYLSTPSQNLQETYFPNGAIYISTPKLIREKRTFYMENTIPYIMPSERSIDIDSKFDFNVAEFLYQKEIG